MNVFEFSIIIALQNNIFSGLFVGQNLLTLKEVDSTNNFLKNLLSNSKPVPEGTVIMAETQFAGRGQQNNQWHSEPGKNLTFSLLLRPSFLAVANQFDLTRAISLGVFEALYPLLGDGLKIKWPNDIYYGDKKLGGMLIENILQAGQIKNAIIGIGLNINQEVFPDGAGNATSVKQILQKDYDLRTILSDICSHIEAYYLNLKANKVSVIRKAYLSRLYSFNENRIFKAGNEVFTGTITNVKENGLLVIQKGNREMTYNLKEIEFLNK
ncbi:biotin--[acetyl-CoA-carboxylase] ligase [Mucilaginibacter sp.]|uniref:biotin--[acetyl-CoA-carboxylase] ligase n=1 Tax=Mucilaginibacter sp. TaxID=1882438 RepID=UPI00261D41CB|nr:biotin--[acetyl-CoA-carboxylase] ligase [Mucilaginibacter sp.]MDB4924091.1 biotin--[acetyl-CoA-carboxylase] ligase [Mucilaginibacter sp.]